MKPAAVGLGLSLILALVLWQRSPQPSTDVSKRELFSLGTLVQFSVRRPPELPAETADRAIDAAAQEMQQFHARWSADGNGALGQLNVQLRESARAPAPEALRAAITDAIDLCRSSGGRFDPGIGRLVVLWGFDDEDNFREQPPTAAELTTARAQSPSLCTAELGDGELRLEAAGARLDFGASAKGAAVAEAIDILRAHGITDAIVNAGGDLQAIGTAAKRPWRIGIRHPRPQPGQEVLASLELADGEAVFTSGDYERYFMHEGARYHHILDPATGLPATGTRSATVVHTDPVLADAASTALFVAGVEHADAVMQAMGVTQYLLVDAQGGIHASPALAPRLRWPDEPG